IRANAEAAGFNPRIFAGPSVNSTAGYGPVMGSAIANAGSAIAGSIQANEELKIQQAALAMDRENLDLAIQRQTLTPTVGGIYAGRRGGQNGGNNTGYNVPVLAGSAATVVPLLRDPSSVASSGLLFTEELVRLPVGTGGSVTDQSIHERQLPDGSTWFTEFPGMGQRLEDDTGDLASNFYIAPYLLSDIRNNGLGRSYDATLREWVEPARTRPIHNADGTRLEPEELPIDWSTATYAEKQWQYDQAEMNPNSAAWYYFNSGVYQPF
ncbi:MAG: hypothetical protein JKY31_08350, partial [Rhodobacteraceae bacterium]|nr:hypothetical protein [Paracoccaceae bacterium]